MNALEKAKLIKELYELVRLLEQQNLSLFEVARSKKRIQDIFHLCDEPIFQSQILAFKSRTQPGLAAQQFAATTPYHYSFRGYFTDPTRLQQALSDYVGAGWAFLHQPVKGWQIWLLPAIHHAPLHSEWAGLTECYPWLLQQQQQHAYLRPDSALDIPALSFQDAEPDAPLLHILPEPVSDAQLPTATGGAQLDAMPPPVLETVIPPAETAESEPSTELDLMPDQSKQLPVIQQPILPEQIQLGEFSARLQRLAAVDGIARLCVLELQTATQPAHLELVLCEAQAEHWQAQPVYLAAQTDLLGRGLPYLMLLGAPDPLQARACIGHWIAQQQRQCVAIKSLPWAGLSHSFHQFDLFSAAYLQQADSLWLPETGHAYIPAAALHKQKFISFEEAPADFSTPVLLLQEHQKIRVIHGQKRLALSAQEISYPSLMLKRDKQLNWQKIHQVILALPQPIQVLELYRAIQAKIME